MSKPRSARTEALTAKITHPMRKRLDQAVDRLGLVSRNEAVNQALEFWLASEVVTQALERWRAEMGEDTSGE